MIDVKTLKVGDKIRRTDVGIEGRVSRGAIKEVLDINYSQNLLKYRRDSGTMVWIHVRHGWELETPILNIEGI